MNFASTLKSSSSRWRTAHRPTRRGSAPRNVVVPCLAHGSAKRCRTCPGRKTVKTFTATPPATATAPTPPLKKVPYFGERWRVLPIHRTPDTPCVGNSEPRIIVLYRVRAWVITSRRWRHSTDESSAQPEGHPSSDLSRCRQGPLADSNLHKKRPDRPQSGTTHLVPCRSQRE